LSFGDGLLIRSNIKPGLQRPYKTTAWPRNDKQVKTGIASVAKNKSHSFAMTVSILSLQAAGEAISVMIFASFFLG
jgi:hypothetical protein